MIAGINIPGDFLAWLVRTSLQASVLIALIVGAQWLFQDRLSPRARFALWWLIVLRLMIPVSIESPVSILNLNPHHPFEARSNKAARHDVVREVTSPPKAIGSTESPIPSQGETASSESVPPPQEPPQGQWSWNAVAFAVWLAGAVFLATTIITIAFLHRRRIRFLPRVTEQRITALFTECRKRVGINRAIELRQSYEETSPALCGLLSPVLLIPKDLVRRLRSDQLRHVFLHELAHFKRGDIAFNWLTSLLVVAHWFNPLLWWALRRMRSDAEFACDAFALSFLKENENQAYGETVLELTVAPQHPIPLPGQVGIRTNHQPIKRRIQMIAKCNRNRGQPLLVTAIVFTLATIGFTSVAQHNLQGDQQRHRRSGTMAQKNESDTRSLPDQDTLVLQGEPDSVGNKIGKTEDFRSSNRAPVSSTSRDQAKPQNGKTNQMHKRTYKLDPNVLVARLQDNSESAQAGLAADQESQEEPHDLLRRLFGGMGIDLESPSRLFYNNRTGVLFVRAPAKKLKRLDRVIERLTSTPPQINLEMRFIQTELSTTFLNENRVKAELRSNGTLEELLGFFSLEGSPSQQNRNSPRTLQGNGEGKDRSSKQTVVEPVVLTEPEFRVFWDALEGREGIEVLASPRVTTLSGREANIATPRQEMLPSLPPGGAGSEMENVKIQVGPFATIVPFVTVGKKTTRLRVIAGFHRLSERPSPRQPFNGSSHRRYILSTFRTEEDVNLLDGQTAVMGGWRFQGQNGEPKQVLMFVTATLIDPAGNPLN